MTQTTNPAETVLNAFKNSFAPVTEALNNLKTADLPEATRDFVKRAAETAQDRAAEAHAGVEKVTAAIENAAIGSVNEGAKVSRNIQQAVYEDIEAFFTGINKLASATSLSDAFQIQSDYLRSRAEVATSRTKSASDYVGKLFAEGARNAQENLAKASASVSAAVDKAA